MTDITVMSNLNTENIALLFFTETTTFSEEFKDVYEPIMHVGDFKAKLNEIFVAYNYNNESPVKRIFLIGLGKKETLTTEKIRRVFGALGSKVRNKDIETLGLDLTPLSKVNMSYIEAALEGVLLGNYKYQTMKTDEKSLKKPLKSLSVKSSLNIDEAIHYAVTVSEGTNLARELGNLPSNVATPKYLAEEAKKLSSIGINVTVLEKDEILQEKMGLFEAVFKGSADIDPPRFIIMEYSPETYTKTLVLVGKAITFDTGGVSLKPVAGMGLMISDMCGGGAVIGAMHVIGELKPKIRVIGLVPSTPNVVDGLAYRPGDVITSRAGKTVEIISTDAEGRMLLADSLDYAKKYQPDLVLNFATLTGSIERALGPQYAGFFLNEQAKNIEGLENLVFSAGQKSGDKLWQMPMDRDYFQNLKSKYADIKQSGGAYAGATNAALFLNEFTDYAWIHFDIAGTAFLKSPLKPANYNAHAGATGFGVRFISQFIRDWK